MDAYGLKEGIVITYNQDRVINQGNKKITLLPAWRWLLEETI